MTPVSSSIFLLARRRVPSYTDCILLVDCVLSLETKYCCFADTYSSLGELLSTLILGVLDQFHDAALVGRETGNFANNAADESSALAESLNVVGDASLSTHMFAFNVPAACIKIHPSL